MRRRVNAADAVVVDEPQPHPQPQPQPRPQPATGLPCDDGAGLPRDAASAWHGRDPSGRGRQAARPHQRLTQRAAKLPPSEPTEPPLETVRRVAAAAFGVQSQDTSRAVAPSTVETVAHAAMAATGIARSDTAAARLVFQWSIRELLLQTHAVIENAYDNVRGATDTSHIARRAVQRVVDHILTERGLRAHHAAIAAVRAVPSLALGDPSLETQPPEVWSDRRRPGANRGIAFGGNGALPDLDADGR